jgi:cytochrome c biogenesis protein CcdA
MDFISICDYTLIKPFDDATERRNHLGVGVNPHMLAKKILSAALIVFLAAILGTLVTKHVRQDRSLPADKSLTAETGECFIVYYFHGRERCERCVNAEAFGREAVEKGFERDFAEGILQWRAVDFDQPANRHFDEDFQLGGIPTIVLAKMENGKTAACVLIPATWPSLTSDAKGEFIEYLRKEVREFMRDYGETKSPPAEKNEPRSYAWALLWAFWLGLFTAITPCTLASNVAAVSYIGRQIGDSRRILFTGASYALGQTLAYTALGFVLVVGLLISTAVSSFLHRYAGELLGPALVLTAAVLLGLVQFGNFGPAMSEALRKRTAAMGIAGAFLLGVLFAVTFCPVSGGLFFLQLIPQAAYCNSPVAMPALYGVGNALPVVVFAFILAFSAQSLGKIFNRLMQVELWIRRLAGVVFLAVGIYFTLRNVFDLPI